MLYKILALVSAAVIFSSCSTVRTYNCPDVPQRYPDVIYWKDADITSIADSISFDGKIEDLIEWNDKSGWHRFLIAEYRKGRYLLSADWRSTIQFVRYDEIGGDYVFGEAERFVDSNTVGDTDDFDYVTNSSIVVDADNNGMAEVYCHYIWSFGDGGALVMMINDGRNFSGIVGRIPHKKEWVHDYEVDSTFSQLTPDVQKFALEYWEKFFLHRHDLYQSGCRY